MNGNVVSKRILVTLADAVHTDLEGWADAQGRPTANLAAYLIESGVQAAKERGEFRTRTPPKSGQLRDCTE